MVDPDTGSAARMLDVDCPHFLESVQGEDGVLIHRKVVIFQSEFQTHNSIVTQADKIQDLWDALPKYRTRNCVALISTAQNLTEATRVSDLRFYGVAFIMDKNKKGWHVLIFDQSVRRKLGNDRDLESIVDQKPAEYMPTILVALVQMLMTETRKKIHPIFTIRYGDGIRVTESRELDLEQATDTNWKRTVSWIRGIIRQRNNHIRNNDMSRQGMAILSPSSINTGMRQWYDDFTDTENPHNKIRGLRGPQFRRCSSNTDSRMLRARKSDRRRANHQAIAGRRGMIPNLPNRQLTPTNLRTPTPPPAYEANPNQSPTNEPTRDDHASLTTSQRYTHTIRIKPGVSYTKLTMREITDILVEQTRIVAQYVQDE